MVPGVFQILIIALIVLLLFGRGRIGDSLGELGKGVKSFRRGLNGDERPDPVVVVEASDPQSAADN